MLTNSLKHLDHTFLRHVKFSEKLTFPTRRYLPVQSVSFRKNFAYVLNIPFSIRFYRWAFGYEFEKKNAILTNVPLNLTTATIVQSAVVINHFNSLRITIFFSEFAFSVFPFLRLNFRLILDFHNTKTLHLDAVYGLGWGGGGCGWVSS